MEVLFVRFLLLATVFLVAPGDLRSQSTDDYYWVPFTDKEGSLFDVNQPEAFLSERAIARREKQDISITEEDLPVSQAYLSRMEEMNLEVLYSLKWLNGVVIATQDSLMIDTLHQLPFVSGYPELIKPGSQLKSGSGQSKFKLSENGEPDYGLADDQLTMLNMRALHQDGYEGQGMLVALLDAGYTNADKVSSLQHIWQEERIYALRDFVKDGRDFFNSHAHGTVVLSVLAGIEDRYLYGSAPKSQFALIRTEDAYSEYLIEEYNWMAGAEYADSIGADVINSSLGYSLFDAFWQNHSYSDMDGNTTPVARAASIASQKGMLHVNSAGNSGGSPWFKITSPADAQNIIAVGAVDSVRNIAPFSSRGPSYDGRVKPDVTAMGFRTIAQHPQGYLYNCNGTSCSAPLIAGAVTALWQKHPEATSIQVREALLKSASQYSAPDSIYGYGIPNLLIASRIIEETLNGKQDNLLIFNAFPNPFSSDLYVELFQTNDNSPADVNLTLYDVSGRKVWQDKLKVNNQYFIYSPEGLENLPSGIYKMVLRVSGDVSSVALIKIKTTL